MWFVHQSFINYLNIVSYLTSDIEIYSQTMQYNSFKLGVCNLHIHNTATVFDVFHALAAPIPMNLTRNALLPSHIFIGQDPVT